MDAANIGMPAISPRIAHDSLKLAQEIKKQKLHINPNCAARTLIEDVIPIVDITQKTGLALETYLFQGSSPIRQYAEDWDVQSMIKTMSDSITFAEKEGLKTAYVTEDTIRSHPDTLRTLFKAALHAGVKRLCHCDTVGHATADGITALYHFTQEIIKETGATDIKIDWHGHNDRGLALSNALTAVECGYDRVHGTALGMGERVGNTSADLLLVNLKLLGWIDWDLSALAEYCQHASHMMSIPLPNNYPVFGSNAFQTGTGIHAAALIKALKKGDTSLANLVYSGVPANDFGLEQTISIGPMSGHSNVLYWLEKNNIHPQQKLVEKIYNTAKKSSSILSDESITNIVNEFRSES